MVEHPGSYQAEIYGRGLADELPSWPTNPAALEDLAAGRLDPAPFGYVHGAAGDGATKRANAQALARRQIVPRMLTGATDRTTATTVLGTHMPAPLLTAPVGVQSILHPDGELATARAAAALGVPMVLSTHSSYPMEEVAVAGEQGPRWFQLYWPNDEEVTASLLRRATAAGFTHLVVTLDTWALAWRPEDLDRAYLPFLRATGTATAFSDPAFRAGLTTMPEDDPGPAIARWLSMFTGHDHTWADLELLREWWDGPILLKGIQHPDDALRALDCGVEGMVVSNHGGRQVDGAAGSLDLLPGVVAAVDGRASVLFDSGIRTGADIFKAVALGAEAVLVGRVFSYALGLGGQEGVRHALRSLLADFDLTLALSGHHSPHELDPAALREAPRPGG